MNTIAVINIARSQLGMEEDTLRALYVRVTGINSLRAMTERQRLAIVEELKRLGFRVTSGGRKLPASTKPYIRLIHALWKSCHRLGVVSDGSRQALRNFCRGCLFPGNETIAVDPDTLDYGKASKVIDALKAMEKRGKAAR
ncbi:regulatory protein GemA [Shinella sp.]|uniref:regulatory protein GemA n=1 Tax=Shinella sp. TaxID=1870904 RepID=UPI003F711DE2